MPTTTVPVTIDRAITVGRAPEPNSDFFAQAFSPIFWDISQPDCIFIAPFEQSERSGPVLQGLHPWGPSVEARNRVPTGLGLA
jgi:hypothetical protein